MSDLNRKERLIMLCPNCKNTISDGSELCPSCGARILYSAADSEYEDRKDLINVVIADGVTEIGAFSFHGCAGLTSVTLGNETETADNAFPAGVEIIRR